MRTDPLGRAGRETGRMKASFMIKTPDAGGRCGSEARSQAAHDARTIVAIKAVFFIRIIPAYCGCGLKNAVRIGDSRVWIEKTYSISTPDCQIGNQQS